MIILANQELDYANIEGRNIDRPKSKEFILYGIGNLTLIPRNACIVTNVQ